MHKISSLLMSIWILNALCIWMSISLIRFGSIQHFTLVGYVVGFYPAPWFLCLGMFLEENLLDHVCSADNFLFLIPLSECGNPPIMFKALTHRHILWHIHYRGASFNCIIQHFLIPKVAQCQSLPPLSSVSAIVLCCRTF